MLAVLLETTKMDKVEELTLSYFTDFEGSVDMGLFQRIVADSSCLKKLELSFMTHLPKEK